jgi:hypothetical protein
VRRWQDLADHVKHRIIVQSVTDFLELVEQTLEHAALDGIGGHKIEDQAIALLTIAVDTAHALLQPVRIPGDVIVEQDMAALQIDPFAGRLSCHQDLDRTVFELLLGKQPRARIVAGA